MVSIFNSRQMMSEMNFNGSLIEIDDNTRKKIQDALFEMYLDIKKVCDKYGIVPYLIGGSSLGAIRHKGFIPWDDDIDIGMVRSDYNRFISIFENELSEKYVINAPNIGKKTKTRFPKVYKKGTLYREIGDYSKDEYNGLFLDIFILENIPKKTIVRYIRGLYCNFLEFVSSQVQMYENDSEEIKALFSDQNVRIYKVKRAIGKVFSFKNSSFWFDAVDKVANYKKETGIHGIVTGRKHYFGEIFCDEVFFPMQKATFNGTEVPVFNNMDIYLSNLYGDYMELPPVEKRERHYIVELDLG